MDCLVGRTVENSVGFFHRFSNALDCLCHLSMFNNVAPLLFGESNVPTRAIGRYENDTHASTKDVAPSYKRSLVNYGRFSQ